MQEKYFWITMAISSLAATASFLTAIFVVRGFQQNVHQQKALIFLDCTKRFSELMLIYPDIESLLYERTLTTADKKKQADFLNAYTSLIHQEYELMINKFINKRIWNMWMKFYEEHMQTNGFADFWAAKKEFYKRKDPQFVIFIQNKLDRIKKKNERNL